MDAPKPCRICGRLLALEWFSLRSSASDGHRTECKQCLNERQRGLKKRPDQIAARKASRMAWANSDRGKASARERSARYHRSDKGRRAFRLKYAKEADKVRARSLVARAVRAGHLLRQPCEKCGQKAHAHHDNYSRPLDVRWFCPKHHKEHHRAMAA